MAKKKKDPKRSRKSPARRTTFRISKELARAMARVRKSGARMLKATAAAERLSLSSSDDA